MILQLAEHSRSAARGYLSRERLPGAGVGCKGRKPAAARGGCSVFPSTDSAWHGWWASRARGVACQLVGSTRSTARFSRQAMHVRGRRGVLHRFLRGLAVLSTLCVNGVRCFDPSPTTPHWPILLTLRTSNWEHVVLMRRKPGSFPVEPAGEQLANKFAGCRSRMVPPGWSKGLEVRQTSKPTKRTGASWLPKPARARHVKHRLSEVHFDISSTGPRFLHHALGCWLHL